MKKRMAYFDEAFRDLRRKGFQVDFLGRSFRAGIFLGRVPTFFFAGKIFNRLSGDQFVFRVWRFAVAYASGRKP